MLALIIEFFWLLQQRQQTFEFSDPESNIGILETLQKLKKTFQMLPIFMLRTFWSQFNFYLENFYYIQSYKENS